MSTIGDLLKSSLRQIGVLGSGEAGSASELQDAMSAANTMLSSWSNKGLLIPVITREEFPLVSSQQTYTLGTGGNFDTARPAQILRAGIIDLNGSQKLEIPIRVLNVQEWSSVALKSLTSTLPQAIYVEDIFPLTNIIVWPIPNAGKSIALYSKKPFAAFTALTDVVALQPGYEDTLIDNLSVKLAWEYGKSIDPGLVQSAKDGLADLVRANSKPVLMTSDLDGLKPTGRFYRILSGQ